MHLIVLIYLMLGQGGNFKEQKTKISDLKSLNLAFLMLALMYTVGIMCGFIPFSFLPLYLSEIHGLPIEEVNRLLGLLRIIGLFSLALGGLLSDRLGPLKNSTFALILSGIFLFGIGLNSNNILMYGGFFPICYDFNKQNITT